MIIEDGTGSGSKLKINSNNRIEALAVSVSYLEDLNRNHGTAWIVPMDALAPSGATKFIYMLNNGLQSVGVACVHINSSAAGVYRFTKVSGTAAGGTAIVPSPVNLGSTILAPVLVYGGASITGLTDMGILLLQYVQANVPIEATLYAHWWLTPNTAIAIQAPAAATVNGVFLVYAEV
jgi:hypothetical protein